MLYEHHPATVLIIARLLANPMGNKVAVGNGNHVERD